MSPSATSSFCRRATICSVFRSAIQMTTKQSDNRYFLGIDVGTGSARAGVFDRVGRLIGSDSAPVALWREAGDIVEQSSEEIWRAVCRSVRGAVAQGGIALDSIAGIGFDATCSLVV